MKNPFRIMIVDDDPDIGSALASFLEAEGFEVVQAENGKEALNLLREARHPDLILLDLMMPYMDGYAFRQEQLRSEGLAEIPTIVLTAGKRDRRMEGLRLVAQLGKPIDSDNLLALIEDHRSRQTRALAGS